MLLVVSTLAEFRKLYRRFYFQKASGGKRKTERVIVCVVVCLCVHVCVNLQVNGENLKFAIILTSV